MYDWIYLGDGCFSHLCYTHHWWGQLGNRFLRNDTCHAISGIGRNRPEIFVATRGQIFDHPTFGLVRPTPSLHRNWKKVNHVLDGFCVLSDELSAIHFASCCCVINAWCHFAFTLHLLSTINPSFISLAKETCWYGSMANIPKCPSEPVQIAALWYAWVVCIAPSWCFGHTSSSLPRSEKVRDDRSNSHIDRIGRCIYMYIRNYIYIYIQSNTTKPKPQSNRRPPSRESCHSRCQKLSGRISQQKCLDGNGVDGTVPLRDRFKYFSGAKGAKGFNLWGKRHGNRCWALKINVTVMSYS